jgi:hypothetical protein
MIGSTATTPLPLGCDSHGATADRFQLNFQ